MSTAAVIVAAGRGARAGGPLPKQWQRLGPRPVLAHALAAFRAVPDLRPLVLVLQPDDFGRARALPEAEGAVLVAGGPSRADSVLAALEHLAADPPGHVLIHDGARPLVSPALIGRVRAALADGAEAAAPGVPVTDALWRVTGRRVAGLADRTGLYAAQTPQGFAFAPLLAAHRARAAAGQDALDDVAVALAAGLGVTVVPGEAANLKITLPEDFARAEREVQGGMEVRTGTGLDVHAFGPGDHVMLCGVAVPHDRGLVGHSDADVGLHALADALYGALAEGDIGRHFPPSDPQWKGAASEIFLAHAAARVRDRGFRIANVDLTLVCERPKIAPHAARMTAKIAALLGIDAGRVSVKATTSERLGFAGREEGIAALATATLIAP
jgi:2-C-methyl-D-erythritol 4-phosphate cytidylyltransferase/2-C-methyl-D-erythritol 2,4-cyclodiphosphate synthase